MSEVEVAVECTKAIDQRISDDNVRKGYAQRARRFHTDIFTLGTAYVVATAAARSSARLVEKGLDAKSCEELVNFVWQNKGDLGREEASYALYGGALLYALKKGGLVGSSRLVDVLTELSSKPYVDQAAYKYAEWLKKLAEAYFK